MRQVISLNSTIVISLFLIYIIYFFIGDFDFSSEILFTFLVSDLLLLVLFFKYNKRRNLPANGQFLKVSTLFLFGFAIVHYQMYIDVLLDNYQNFGHDFIYDFNYILKSVCVSSIALSSFIVGYRVKLSRFKNLSKSINDKASLTFHNVKFSSALSAIVLVLYILVFLLLVTVDSRYFNGGYGRDGVEVGGLGGYINDYIIIVFITYLVVWLLFKRKSGVKYHSFFSFLKGVGFGYICILCIFCLLTLMSGDRGPVLQVSLAFIGTFILMYKHKIRFIIFIGLVSLGIFTFSFVAYIRENKDVNSYAEKIALAKKNQLESSKNYSFSPSTYELATSIRTLQACLIYTDNNELSYGIFQGLQILNVIPGLGSLVGGVVGLDVSRMNSAEFLTFQILGPYPTHGLGTSAVADIYVDFGVLGTIVLFFFFGITVCLIEQRVFVNTSNNIFYYAFFLVLLSFSIYIARSSILSVFRDCFLVFLFSNLFVFLFKRN